jgi:hypothetical protein
MGYSESSYEKRANDLKRNTMKGLNRNFKRTQVDDEAEDERVEKYEPRQRRKKTSVKEFYREEYDGK